MVVGDGGGGVWWWVMVVVVVQWRGAQTDKKERNACMCGLCADRQHPHLDVSQWNH
jgi:hypothetical protein